MTTIEKILEEFDRFVRDDFDTPPNGETHRWVFCCDDNKVNDGVYDCACCLSSEDLEMCNCVCHHRIDTIKDFIRSAITRAVEEREREILDGIK